ncbi:MAG: LON peptidase substrate-binding domain-containing protein [Pseudomonadota bacterium]|nr:LON peptidase substrate-binding domain-containing protein [Pseudomonadota bacterium]
MTDIPLFPLGTVLFPSGRLPLQIFERRYVDMISKCMREGSGFGVVWIRRGSEVAEASVTNLDLGDYGTMATIVDWDQLPNGLLGITIEGTQRFHIEEVWREDSGLNMARVDIEPSLDAVEIPEEGRSMIDVLAGLQRHPEVRRLGLTVDTGNAWNICHVLTQLLPIDNSVKYELLGITDIKVYVDELDELLSELSG